MNPFSMFREQAQSIKDPVVMEIGTRRVAPNLSTRRDHWVPHAARYIGVDYIEGLDVDIVADVHKLAAVVGKESCDIIITCSTFEHIKYPHLAAHQVLQTLRVGGLLYVHTVQTFPLHGFPHDYFRFSREGLMSLFGTKMGFEIIATDYHVPAQIHSELVPQTKDFDAFLNVHLFGKKIASTPEQYIYEMESF